VPPCFPGHLVSLFEKGLPRYFRGFLLHANVDLFGMMPLLSSLEPPWPSTVLTSGARGLPELEKAITVDKLASLLSKLSVRESPRTTRRS